MKLVISNIDIHQDAEGRFSLNDLHRASGGDSKNQPSNFLRSEQTQKLIEAINRCSDSSSDRSSYSMSALSTKEGGKNQGSYGVKELVYAYANWISADFYLQMIRTFDKVATGKIGTSPRNLSATISQQIAVHGIRMRLLDKLELETHPVKRIALHGQLDHTSRLLGLPTPAIEAIGCNILPDHESPLLEEFWEVVDALLQAGKDMNHARDKTLLALNLPQVYTAAAAAKMTLPDKGIMRRLLRACRSPRFVDVKAVNSAHSDGAVKCWVFSQQPATQSARH